MTTTVVTTGIEVGAAALRAGQLVAFPTETVYGLGADAARSDAVTRIFQAKGRPAGHPLIVHLADPVQAGVWVDLDLATGARFWALAERFWPGPLTIVVPRSDRVAPETVGDRSTVGLRVPAHPVALALLLAFGGGVAAPSANRFGRVSPTTAAHVLADLDGLVEVVIDGGPTEVGLESTIVELVGPSPVLLRPGGVSRADLEDALGVAVVDGRAGEARASGMLVSHYAPRATVELTTAEALSALVCSTTVGRPEPDGAGRRSAPGSGGAGRSAPGSDVGFIAPAAVAAALGHQPTWALPDDDAGYARAVYAALRAADEAGVRHLLVVPPASGPLVDAVLDRLTKAAAPRPT